MQFSRFQQIGLWILAVASLVTALSLLWWAGLPERADFSGFVIDGIYVAPEIGGIAPPIEAGTLSGERVSLADFRGESVVINFWATWCAPCAIEMPELQSLHEETGVPILGVNIAEPEQFIDVWVDEYALTFDIVLDPDSIIYEQYRVIGQPSTYVVSPDGIITHIFYGPTTGNTLRIAINTHQHDG